MLARIAVPGGPMTVVFPERRQFVRFIWQLSVRLTAPPAPHVLLPLRSQASIFEEAALFREIAPPLGPDMIAVL
jgi:hypothetical protein